MNRRNLVAALAAAFALPALAQGPAWPAGQPIIAVVPFSAGGSVDVAARITMPRLGEKLKQTVVVENTVGASGTIAAQRVINARPDGYTLFFAVNSPVTVAPLVSPNIHKFDGLRDLVPVAAVASAPFVLVGRPTLPAANAGELVKLIRSQPGKLNFGTDGVGTGLHVTAEMLKQQASLDMVHVPYKSGPQVLTEVAGGQIDLAVLPMALVQAFVRDGKVKAYGVTSAQRWSALPDVPALAETAEFKGLDVNSWVGVLLPAQTDRAIVDRLAQAIDEMVAEPETVKKLSDAGYKPMQLSGRAFGTYLAKEKKDLAAAIAAAKIRVD